MLEKIKRFFGGGKEATAVNDVSAEEIAALVRAISYGYEAQNVLFHPGNEKCLLAFVEYGHTLNSNLLGTFFAEAPSRAVEIYLERGEELSEESINAILARNDDILVQALLASGSWAPFPYGSSMSHPGAIHHDHHEFPEEGAPAMA